MYKTEVNKFIMYEVLINVIYLFGVHTAKVTIVCLFLYCSFDFMMSQDISIIVYLRYPTAEQTSST